MDKCAKIILKQPAVFNVTNEILSNECTRVSSTICLRYRAAENVNMQLKYK